MVTTGCAWAGSALDQVLAAVINLRPEVQRTFQAREQCRSGPHSEGWSTGRRAQRLSSMRTWLTLISMQRRGRRCA